LNSNQKSLCQLATTELYPKETKKKVTARKWHKRFWVWSWAWRGWMAPGARSKFGSPILEPEVFRKQMYCIEVSICDGELFPTCPPPRYAPASDALD